MKIDRVFNSKEEKETEEKFYKAIMTLSNLDEHKAFLTIFVRRLNFSQLKIVGRSLNSLIKDTRIEKLTH